MIRELPRGLPLRSYGMYSMYRSYGMYRVRTVCTYVLPNIPNIVLTDIVSFGPTRLLLKRYVFHNKSRVPAASLCSRKQGLGHQYIQKCHSYQSTCTIIIYWVLGYIIILIAYWLPILTPIPNSSTLTQNPSAASPI